MVTVDVGSAYKKGDLKTDALRSPALVLDLEVAAIEHVVFFHSNTFGTRVLVRGFVAIFMQVVNFAVDIVNPRCFI